ncbi:inactive protein RESTRICTED TEV MOVEMENT 2-like [Triticum urartu]|uniref:SHSP domain-containing protein n=1 Tax=Triticum urartu TaxID=4572 RepID=A0A8R7TB57_TRIUA|nr:inactive protein RESTRICTED TEV MOVEMENT 2-like [Triticum urartu]
MAATATSQQQPAATPAAAAAVVDPKFEWAEKAGTYVLRLTLTGFRKDDFRVQVDGAGRLTVRGTRPGASLHKVFQLPATASLDDIAGRFEAGVLTLTVPKRAGAAPAPPTSIEEIKKTKPGGAAKEEKAKPTPPAEVDDAAKSMPAKPTPPTEVDGAKKMPREEGAAKLTPQAEVDGAKKMSKEEGAVKPPPLTSHQLPSKDGGAGKKEKNGAKQPATRDDGGEKKEAVIGSEPKESTLGRTTRQVAEHVHRMEEAKRRKQIEHMPAPASKKEEEVKPKAPQPAAAAMTPEKPAPKAEVADGEKAKAEVDPESLAERVRRRGEEERAKAAAAATAMEAKTEQAKKAVASTCTAWKNRIAGELKGLTDMKWADNAVEMARRNKEVVAVGVAAFSIGFLVSQKLFRK